MNHPRLTSVSSGSMSLQHWILNGHLGWNLQPVITTSVPGTDPGMLCKVNWPARGIVRYNAFEYGWPCPERTFSAGPNSTVCPAYNTAILCAIFSAIARLCVMSNNPILSVRPSIQAARGPLPVWSHPEQSSVRLQSIIAALTQLPLLWPHAVLIRLIIDADIALP